MYRIDIMTLFPETVGDVLSESILGRAQERDLLRIETHQIRDYTTNKQNQVDDYPYGGGRGRSYRRTRCTAAGNTSANRRRTGLTPSSSPPAAGPSPRRTPGGWPGSMTI